MSGAVNFKNCGSVLITGANRGLGLQMVESLASGVFSPGKIIGTTRNLTGYLMIPLNQESIEKCAEVVGQLVKDEGLNCLINNAGINVVAELHSVTAEKMMENFHTNAVAPLMITKAFLPLLKRAASRGASRTMGIQRAAVINVSSLLGSVELNWGEGANTFRWYPYRASKSALNMVSRCLAIDLEPDGILCTAIHPGWVRTDMGGSEAPLSPEESIASVLSVIGGLTEKEHGSFMSFTGEQLPW
uniref:Si:dkey-12e7.4 n=1 Tax=Poecilia latipinna TaxID=48699 RepID=A0A3B3U446_9TELE